MSVVALQRQPSAAPPGDRATWLASINGAADSAALQRVATTVVTELRAHLAAHDRGVHVDAIAEALGQKLWALAHGLADFGNTSHFLPLQEIRSTILRGGATGATPPAGRVRRLLRQMARTFEFAARGASTVRFPAAVAGTQQVRVLVTGFDPFGSAAPEHMNPTGALAMALDGAFFPVTGATVFIESVVLPVDFSAFRGGIVERIGRHALGQNVDAILTVSLDPDLPIGSPVQLERYVVGVHEDSAVSRTPREPRRRRHDRLIIEAPVSSMNQVVTDVGPTAAQVRTNMTFLVPPSDEARFMTASGGVPDRGGRAHHVTVSDPARIGEVMNTMRETGDGTWIRFRIGSERFRAQVIEGPGGNFLSNEVSYRMLRMLRGRGRGAPPVTSFHTHVPPFAARSDVPQAGTPARAAATTQRTLLINRMNAIIRSVATQIVTARGSATTP